ncbi:MAG: inositol monophosphatase [Chloroflexi bacterium]|nr:inositol monophosphatase [Chloroflexota bacterium]
MEPTLSDLERLARQAGGILRAYFGRELRIDFKGEIDLVTEADHRSEEYLIREINARFPGDRILTEESGDLHGDGGGLWYIDPLDGTVNYAHRLPIYCVSVAYQKHGAVQLGVVYDPSRDECFSAQKGQGAWLNGAPIHPSTQASLEQSLLVTGFPYDIRENPDNNLKEYARFCLLTQGVRRLGSAALDLCYVAAGRLDGYWELRISPWDVAAGALIVQEAGGVATDIHGQADFLSPPQSILAAPPALHSRMLATLST